MVKKSQMPMSNSGMPKMDKNGMPMSKKPMMPEMHNQMHKPTTKKGK